MPSPDAPLIVLRAATPAELPAVTALAASAFERLGDYAAILDGWCRSPGVQTTIATVAGETVGFLAWAFLRRDRSRPPVLELLALAVAPPWRRRGLGRRLLWQTLALAEEHAGAVGAREAALHVARDNDGARALFEQLGFRRDPPADTLYPTGVPGLRMVRPLEGTAALVLETA